MPCRGGPANPDLRAAWSQRLGEKRPNRPLLTTWILTSHEKMVWFVPLPKTALSRHNENPTPPLRKQDGPYEQNYTSNSNRLFGRGPGQDVFHACGMTRAHANPDCCRLMTIPGIGVLSASELLVKLGDGSEFRNGREASASIGLVPRQHSTGGKPKLGASANEATALCAVC